MVNEKTIDFRMRPYIQESGLQAGIDILVMIVSSVVLSVVAFPPAIIICIVVGYFTIAVILHYRVLIQAFIDRRKGDFITETVSVTCFKEEYSFAGDWLGQSYIHVFYPKELHVQKCIMKVVNHCDEEKKLRSVMSFRRLLNFSILDKQQIQHVQVTYLKRSKILLWCSLIEEPDKTITQKKKRELKKVMHFINMSI